MPTDKFYSIPLTHLLSLILNQLKDGHIFGIPSDLFFKPNATDKFRIERFGKLLETPWGVAAGPHTQMAQNIIAAWLCGARFIELKTVQTLDEIDISKPCIDMQDEGYNCEWSQELKMQESFHEYLNAWIIIHILDKILNVNKNYKDIGTIFNMSVGYNMDGILNENVQWFFAKMNDCTDELQEKIEQIKSIYADVNKLNIPAKLSNNITLSTMHGCPADEIEKIGLYLIEKLKLHTTIKLNPTLLGADELRHILNVKLGYKKLTVPDEAFGHDLKYPDALNIIKSLAIAAKSNNVFFSLKLTNTLEVINHKDVFKDENEMMYMSGRALHPIAIHLGRKLQNEFDGKLDISFCAGADCFNVSDILSCGFQPVTVCSDLLKPGGYLRMLQYTENLNENLTKTNSGSIREFIFNKNNFPKNEIIIKAALHNLNNYASVVADNPNYQKHGFVEPNIKTTRELKTFDCISAPCVETCPTNQNIPDYMFYTSKGDYKNAFKTILDTNPFPTVTGMICDHLCQFKCTRINYDNSLHIREIKRFIANHAHEEKTERHETTKIKVAIIGAGPSGLSCANYLALAGFDVTIYEAKDFSGGMVSSAIPTFRLKDIDISVDVERIEKLGVKIIYHSTINKQKFDELHKTVHYIYVSVGAQLATKFEIEGIESKGVLNVLEFLFKARKNEPTGLGKNVAIIGGGNTAMDAARTAFRLVGNGGKITIIYRRTREQMPADFHEIEAVIDEGIEILELTSPEKIITKNEIVTGLVCAKMKLEGIDKSGRSKPVRIEDSEQILYFDCVIPAIGQDLNIDFVDEKLLKTDTGYNTQLANVFIGGDAKRGASTAINAIADGKKIAEQIILAENSIRQKINPKVDKILSYSQLIKRKATREFGVKINETDLTDRKNFKLVTQTLSETEAKIEAARCLSCDEVCNICVTVCPNLANYSYKTKASKIELNKAVRKGKNIEIVFDKIFEIKQNYQILNIGNFCNECGNCSTFCPTNGAPYMNKPKFYLTHESFDKVPEGYFIEQSNGNKFIYHKTPQETSILVKTENDYQFVTTKFKATISLNNYELKSIEFSDDFIQEAKIEQAIEMSILLENAALMYV